LNSHVIFAIELAINFLLELLKLVKYAAGLISVMVLLKKSSKQADVCRHSLVQLGVVELVLLWLSVEDMFQIFFHGRTLHGSME
jgi:hypothetical protein